MLSSFVSQTLQSALNMAPPAVNPEILLCNNCEEHANECKFVCRQCSDDNGEAIFVLCGECNVGLHKSKSNRNHAQSNLYLHSRPLSRIEAGAPSLAILKPDVKKTLCMILCEICDAPNVNTWCHECNMAYCSVCSDDIHKPKKLAAHSRVPFTQKYMHNEKSTTAKSAPTRRESIMAHNKKAAVVKPTVNSFRKQMDTLSVSVIKESEEVEEEAAEDLPISSPKQDAAVKKGGLHNRRLSSMDPSKALFKSLVKKLRRGSVLKKADEDTVPGSLINLIDPQLHEDFEVKPLRLTEKVVSLSCGPDHCGAVTVAGCLYMWGCNLDSQLGVPTPARLTGDDKEMCIIRTPLLVPFSVTTAVQQVACGFTHTLCVTRDGDVYSWGSGRFGVLGHGDVAKVPNPTKLKLKLPGVGGNELDALGEMVTKVCAGQFNSGVVVRGRNDGYQLYLWGAGSYGQLGNEKLTPEMIPALISVIGTHNAELDAANDAVVINNIFAAIDVDAKGVISETQLKVWLTSTGNLGEHADATVKLLLAGLDHSKSGDITREDLKKSFESMHTNSKDVYRPDILSICFGDRHTIALACTGKVYSWGNNEFGQLGYPAKACNFPNDPNSVRQSIPKEIPGLEKVTQITSGTLHCSCLTSSGRVFSWGSGETHQLGLESKDDRDHFAPHETKFYESNSDVRATVRLGLSSKSFQDSAKVVFLSTGRTLSGAVTDNGLSWLWGYGVDSMLPRPVQALKTTMLQRLDVGSPSCVVAMTGESQHIYVREWHANGANVTDDESCRKNCAATYKSKLGLPLSALPATYVPKSMYGRHISNVSCNTGRYAVITTTGDLAVWGSNDNHGLGLPIRDRTDYAKNPIVLTSLKCKITTVSCGRYHTLVLDESGRVFTWGFDQDGSLGQGDEMQKEEPQNRYLEEPTLLQGNLKGKIVTHINTGPSNSAVVTSLGQLYIWGANGHNQLGTNTATEKKVEKENKATLCISMRAHKVKNVQLGEHHCLCITDKGTLYAWGRNDMGQLGLGHCKEVTRPFPNLTLDKFKIVSIACGRHTSLALTAKGKLFGWGNKQFFQLPGCAPTQNPDDLLEKPEHVLTPAEILCKYPDDGKLANIVTISMSAYDCVGRSDEGELFVWGQHTSQLTPVIALVPQCQKPFVQDTEIRDVAIMWTSGKQGIPPVAYMMDTLRI